MDHTKDFFKSSEYYYYLLLSFTSLLNTRDPTLMSRGLFLIHIFYFNILNFNIITIILLLL